MINPTIHLRICLSIHQRDCLFSPHQVTSSSSLSLHCILLLIEFPRWNFIPDATLFVSSLFLFRFFLYCIKSRDHFTAILSRRLSLGSTHPLRPFLSTPVPDFSFFSDNCTLVHTRRAFLSTMQSDKITARHTVFKMDQVCATTLILLRSTSTCMECSRAARWRIHPNADCLRLNIVTRNTRNSYSDTRYLTLLSRGFMYV